MPFFDACKGKILSEDYRDFIVSDSARSLFAEQEGETICQVATDFIYEMQYVYKTVADPVNLENYGYNEIPKCYTLLGTETLQQAGILQVQGYPGLELMGAGVMVGFIDTGIDYTNAVFRNLDGSTRILGIWDQTIQSGDAPEGFFYGTEYTREAINTALLSEDPKSIVPSRDSNGHGTFLASVTAGGASVENDFLGAAPETTIGVVKLKPAKRYLREYYHIREETECYQETDIMLAVQYLQALATKNNLPLVICLALGTNQGSHNGTSPLGGMLELLANMSNRAVVIGGGNEAGERHHFAGELRSLNDVTEVEVQVNSDVRGFCMELWTDIPNILAISILSPTGERIPRVPIRRGKTETYQFLLEGTIISIDYILLSENSNSELIYFRVDRPAEGIWTFIVEPVLLAEGTFHIWLPVKEFLDNDVFFLQSNPYNTLTEPSNIISGLTTAFYDGRDNSVAISSGRGYTRERRIKPDLAAPGVDVEGIVMNDRITNRSGSSVSTGITAGAVALLMEWILYSLERPSIDAMQIRNLLILGARKRPGEIYPNQEWGYGQLDLFHTFEVLRSI